MNVRARATLFVFLAALAWGVEYVVPFPSVSEMHPAALTFWGHLVGLLLLLPFVLRPSRREFSLLSLAHAPHLLSLAIGGEVVAGMLFAATYQSVGEAGAVFLLMLRPFFALPLAYLFLKERRSGAFVQWAFWVFLGAAAIFVFHPQLSLDAVTTPAYGRGAGIGMFAVLLWSLATVSGKQLLEDFSPSTVLFLRWALSLPGFLVSMLILRMPFELEKIANPSLLVALAGYSFFLALAPLWVYYRGLKHLPASLTSFVELACPLAVVFLPALFGGRKASEMQWLGGASIVAGVALLVRLEVELQGRQKGKMRR